MNGFISPKALRFTLVASACLLSGFVSGTSFHGLNVEKIFPKKEISYSKISWISNAFEPNKIALATVDYPASDLENKDIKLAEFHLPTRKIFANKSPSKNKIRQSNLQKLGEIVANVPSFDLFNDYLMASKGMQDSFILAMSRPALKKETVIIASSSANSPERLTHQASDLAKVVLNQKLVQGSKKNAPLTKKTPILTESAKIKLNTQKLSIQKKPSVVKNEPSESRLGASIAQIEPIEKIKFTPRVEKPLKVQTTKSSAVVAYSIGDEKKRLEDETLGKKLEEELLSQRLKSYAQSKAAKPAMYAVNTATKKPETVQTTPENQIDHNNDVINFVPEEKESNSSCKILPKLRLIKPTQVETSEDTQICATQKTWISKSWADEGWVKVETEDHFPFITYYPQINSNKVLLLDQNSVALLAIRTGVHIAKDMGMILGTLPAGHKIEFSERSEDVQYFDLNGKKYFVILNVEPGAGVTELVSNKNPNENATVFTPVIGGTVTYLDLISPINVSIPMKVIKGTEKISNDVVGLTVGISTQTQIHATTVANGMALLKNVYMVPGYPVFVDVSSKINGERSYQYRYQLNKRTRNGVFILKQYSEKQIYHWFKQIKTSLSDQSGYVFGEFNRKRIDGFRNHYVVKVQSITESYGLNPKNFTVLWDEKLSDKDPLEGDRPRFLSVQIPEGLTQAHLLNEKNQIIQTSLIPVSPRVINVVSE